MENVASFQGQLNRIAETRIPQVGSDVSPIRHDFVVVFSALCDFIVSRVRLSAMRGKTTFRLFNVCDSIEVAESARMTRIRPQTFFLGFWNPETKTHSTEAFREAGVEVMMLEALQQAFSPRGYTIKDVSDPSRSLQHVLEVSSS